MGSGQKPANLTMQDGKGNQQRVWDKLRECQGRISSNLISRKTGIHYRTVKRYMISLKKEGYLEQVGMYFGEPLYNLVKDSGVDFPKIIVGKKESYKETAKEIMWRGVRILGEFSAIDLVSLADVSTPIKLSTAQRFIKHLNRAGYFDLVGKPRPGTLSRYRLRRAMNAGPKTPIVQCGGQVFDPNFGKVFYPVLSD
ncbi:hypothetical protein HBO07_22115 [Pseudomonas proteolytica]|uniref:hypothetical protein n=1 Tax=Pseudomonas proteolytica TaxID=219574 RepID=UPI001475CBB1|nr:hypothetical protein [Pseudomonas proteolytica]NMZ13981.1 hypothetical protein [Pseudomonas proteolytica]